MLKTLQLSKTLFIVAAAAFAMQAAAQRDAGADKDHILNRNAQAALDSLYASTPAAKTLGDKALAVLVFPEIRRAAFVVGALGGEGVLFEKGKPTDYYSSTALSVGLQAGAQSYGYALFFLRPQDLDYLKRSSGWSIGTGPTIVVADAGASKDVTTLTGQSGVYAFIFDQRGLMGGIGLQGQKITKLDRSKL